MDVSSLFFLLFTVENLIVAQSEFQNEISEFEKLLKEDSETGLAVLFTEPCCQCTDCVEAEVLLGGMSKELEENLGVSVVRLRDPALKTRYDVKKTPALVYIRSKKAAMYDGKFDFEELYFWLQENRQPASINLDDKSFEHLTQAATGATTGDWLVLFQDSTCCSTKQFMHAETAAVKLRNKVNVAFVNTIESLDTKRRFKITECPFIIFFRHSKMYYFSLPEINTQTLVRFAEGFYKNSKAQIVPLASSQFDKFLDVTIEYYKKNSFSIVLYLAGIVSSIIIAAICASMLSKSRKKKD